MGSCQAKTLGAGSLEIFVYPEALATPVQSRSGAHGDPHDDLTDAIEAAFEAAAPYDSASVTIYLMNKDSSVTP